METYARAHAWALQRARIAVGLRLPTPPTVFGLAMRHDGIDAVITISLGAGLTACERLRLEASVLSLDGIDLIAVMEPVIGGAPLEAPVAITVRDDDYELRVVSAAAPMSAGRHAELQLLPRARRLH